MKYQRKTKPACWTEAFPDQVRPRLVAARKTIVRKRIRQVSVRQASRNQRYARIRNEFMSQPENKVCCLDGCANWSEDVHHSRGRIRHAFLPGGVPPASCLDRRQPGSRPDHAGHERHEPPTSTALPAGQVQHTNLVSKWNLILLTCYESGQDARRIGKPIEACPYLGQRGFNRQRADYWRDGWRAQGDQLTRKESVRPVQPSKV